MFHGIYITSGTQTGPVPCITGSDSIVSCLPHTSPKTGIDTVPQTYSLLMDFVAHFHCVHTLSSDLESTGPRFTAFGLKEDEHI